MEKIVNMSPSFDKMDEGYGIHGVDLQMVLKGENGAVHFVLFTDWMLPHLRDLRLGTIPADVGYHSPTPRYEGQLIAQAECPYLDGKPCYYDGSGLRANDVFDILTEKGSDGVWEYLEAEYKALFGEEE